MKRFGRFTVVVLHSLLSLAALSSNVASGLPTTAADENGPDPNAVAGAMGTVEADGSVLVRLQGVHPQKISMHTASKGEGGLHRGAVEDDHGVRTRVVIGADGAVDGHAVDVITGVDRTETDESLRMVRRIDVALVDAGSETAVSKQGWLGIGIVVCSIILLCQCMVIHNQTKPKVDRGRTGLLEPTRSEERQGTPPRKSLTESVGSKESQAPPKGKGKGKSNASVDEDDSNAAPEPSSKGNAKGKGKGDSKASVDEDNSKAAPDPPSKGKGKAPDPDKGKGAIQSPDGAPPTNGGGAAGAPDADKGKGAIQSPDGAPPTNGGGAAGAPSPPQPEESSSGAVACNDYKIDMTAATFGACKCGFPKAEHKK